MAARVVPGPPADILFAVSSVLDLLAVPCLILLNAFFVAAEYSLVSLRSGQIEQMRVAHPRAAGTMRKLRDNMSSAIGTIQLCITMSNLVLGVVGEPAMTGLLERAFGSVADGPAFKPVALVMSFVLVTLLTVILSELVPKAIALQYTPLIARLTGPPIWFTRAALRPFVWVMDTLANLTTRVLGLGEVKIGDDTVTADELGHITREAAESGNLTKRERTLILNSLTLGKRTAAEVMVPRVQVNFLDVTRTLEENLAVIGQYLFSRMPLCDGGMDHVLGVIYTKEFYAAYQELRATTDPSVLLLLIAKPPVFAPMTIDLDQLLQRFHDDKSHLVFLVDEHGGVQGIVTLTDVVNELVGPIMEGSDQKILSRSAISMIVRAEMPISHLARHLHRTDWAIEADVRSVGGLMTSQLGRVPHVGEMIEIEGVRLFAHKTTARNVQEVRVIIPVLQEPPQ